LGYSMGLIVAIVIVTIIIIIIIIASFVDRTEAIFYFASRNITITSSCRKTRLQFFIGITI